MIPLVNLVKKQATWSFNPTNILKKRSKLVLLIPDVFNATGDSSPEVEINQVNSALPFGKLHNLQNPIFCFLLKLSFKTFLLPDMQISGWLFVSFIFIITLPLKVVLMMK